MVFPVVMYGYESWTVKKAKVKVNSLSRVRLSATPWTVARQAPVKVLLTLSHNRASAFRWQSQPVRKSPSNALLHLDGYNPHP